MTLRYFLQLGSTSKDTNVAAAQILTAPISIENKYHIVSFPLLFTSYDLFDIVYVHFYLI